MQTAFSWDDLRYVLAIARAGNLRAAASALGVNHSTMFRRLATLERALGSKLFERLVGGYRPTESGQTLIEVAERMEAEAIALDRDLTGRDTRLIGRLRVTASETLAFLVLTDEIARFRVAQPGIIVDLMVENRVLDLSRREADVALRATRPKAGDLFGRKLAEIRWALYASQAYLAAHPAPRRLDQLDRHAIIGWSETSPSTLAAAWLARIVPDAPIAFRSSGFINQMIAVKAGLGIAVLPCYLAEPEAGVRRVLSPIDCLVTELWLITHRSLKDTARVRVFMDFIANGVRGKIAALEHGA
jgi:DNA-binding transcriptional LysR family regulator